MPNPSSDDKSTQPIYSELIVTGYAWGGAEVDTESDLAHAKRTMEGKRNRYFVQRCTQGMDAGQLRNPLSPFHTPHNRYVGHTGQRIYEFMEVTAECFQSYLMFLETKNIVHHTQAERLSR